MIASAPALTAAHCLPLVGTVGGRPVQGGIVGYGLGCAVPALPGGYGEVDNPSLRGFISSTAEI